MSKADDAPIRFSREDHDNATGICGSVVIDQIQYRSAIVIPDDATPAIIGAHLRRLADWFESKVA